MESIASSSYRLLLSDVFGGTGTLRKVLFLDLLLSVIEHWKRDGHVMLLDSLFAFLDCKIDDLDSLDSLDSNKDLDHFKRALARLVDWFYDARDEVVLTVTSRLRSQSCNSLLRARICALLCCVGSNLKENAAADVFDKLSELSTLMGSALPEDA